MCALDFDQQSSRKKRYGGSEHPAQPGCIGPPHNTTHSQHAAQKQHGWYEETDGYEIEGLERFAAFAWRQREGQANSKQYKRNPKLDQIQAAPIAGG